MEEDLVEGIVLHLLLAAIRTFHPDQGAALERKTARQEVGDEGGEVFLAGGGQEAQMAEIDAQNGRKSVGVRAVDKLHGGEQGAVATDRKEVVETVDAVAVADGERFDAGALQFGTEVVVGRKVGRIDVAIIEGYLHCLGIWVAWTII